MLGVDPGSTEIDGFIEGPLDGPTLCVGTSLGFLLGDAESVGIILGDMDGRIDSDGNSLGAVVGIRLTLGPMLGAEEGSTDIDGVDEGSILGLKDGPIDSEGKLLGANNGELLTIGPMLGTEAEEGSTDIDGVNVETDTVDNILGFKDGGIDDDSTLLGSIVDEILPLGRCDGSILCVRGALELSLGESDTVGSKLPLEDGPIGDDGVSLSSDGIWLGLRGTDGCMLGLEFGSITLND
eukprot:scaffold133694_cov35-Attheya_sp.AAC.1